MSKLLPVPLFIGGEWTNVSGVATTPVHNPSIGEIIAETPLCGADVVDQAVRVAADAFPKWMETPSVDGTRLFTLAPRIDLSRLATMKTILPLALAAALLTGCAAIEKAERKSTEQQLAAAGFKVLPANTPQRQTALTQLKPYTISRQIRGDKVFYVYPDPDGDFAYIGDQNAYSAYQQIVVQQQISDQNLMAAQMMDMPGPGMWPGWGYWGY